MGDVQEQIAELEDQIRKLESLRSVLGDDITDQKKAELATQLRLIQTGGGSLVAGDVSTGGGKFVGRDDITAQPGSTVVTGPTTIVQAPPGPKPPSLPQALKRYLDNLIDTHQHLRLQGIRAGGQPLSVALEKVYVSLTAIEKRAPGAGKVLPQDEKGEAEFARGGFQPMTVDAALARYRRLVIIGDPGCGKTTLLAYLALTYARDLRDHAGTVRERLKLDEGDHLPILLPLRDLGRHLKQQHSDSSQDGPALLTDYLQDYYVAQSIQLPEDFFAQALEAGRAAVLLDGMDEVAETRLRQRVARLVEKFAVRYPQSRLVVTSREVGYEGAARIGADFGLAKVREFSPDEVRQFVRDWTRVVEVTLAGRESEDILRMADEQAGQLVQAIETNPRISELAVNPLLLTVIALVHRYRAQLPERRSELYEEAIEVLLARWDEAKGMETEATLAGRQLDAGDRRSLLEPVALWLHEKKRRELELDDLRPLLLPSFKSMAGGDASAAGKALETFARLINERSGLLVERGAGMYGFAHLTFQEYLAARAVADREDAVPFTLKRLADAWWREVVLLEAGYLSTQGRRRVSELVRAIMDADPSTEPQPYHHLILAAECLYDVGAARLEGDLLGEVKRRLKKELDKPLEAVKGKCDLMLRRGAAANALSQIESGQFGVVSKFWQAP
jgi:energy-coupling factor transporter ATP-binding protein EcfA2